MIALIPARGGSKGIKRKNIVDLDGYPLIAYSIAACQLCNSISRVIVSSEDSEIIEVSKQYGAEAPFVRPKEFSKDSSTDVDFLNHFFGIFSDDEVALIRPTTPFRNPLFMENAVNTYFSNKDNITGFRTVSQINENPYKVVKLNNNIFEGFFDNFNGIKNYTNLPRQTFPKAYSGNGHIDIVKRKTVFKGTAFGDIIYGLESERAIDIDSPFDLEMARLFCKSSNDIVKQLKQQIRRNI